MLKNLRKFLIYMLALFCSFATIASAEDDPKPAPTSTWNFGAKLGAAFNIAQSSNYVGVLDGYGIGLGGKLDLKTGYLNGKHEWGAGLSLSESFTRTPLFDQLVKSADLLHFETGYYYHFLNWLAFFARAKMDTSLFKGIHLVAAPIEYDLDGEAFPNSRSFDLSPSFKPVYLQESFGLAAFAFKLPTVTWQFDAGFALLQTFAEGAIAVQASTETAIALKRLTDFYQFGPLLGTSIHGDLKEGVLSYKAGIETIYPAWILPKKDTNPSFLSVLIVNSYAGLSLKLRKWITLDYELRAIRAPEISESFQIQNNLLVSVSYDYLLER